jgi:8-oxo-dGTP diphosphatase
MQEDKFFGMKHKQDTPKVGVAVIVKKDGKFLLGLRTGSHGSGTWSCPGGHVDVGEEATTTCSREIKEELGVDIDPKLFLPIDFHEYINYEEGLHYITLNFLIDLDRPTLNDIVPYNAEPAKCEKIEWFDARTIPAPEDFFNYKTYEKLMSMKCFQEAM